MTPLDRTVSKNLDILLSTVSGIRDGQTDAIHAARVATRRLRAALPLAWAESPKTAWLESAETIRQLGRDLGRIREVDTALEQLPGLEARVPLCAPPIAVVRQELARLQARQHRQLVKNLEELHLDRLPRKQVIPPSRFSLRGDRRWRAVERAIVEHCEQLHRAIEHASGVYFPKRTHRVRVVVKKLRYVLELVAHAELARSAVKRFKRTQELLGELHDQQVLLDTVREEKAIGRRDRDLMVASLDARCTELFQDYASRRSSILDLRKRVERAAILGKFQPETVGGVLLKTGAAAVPSILLWLTRPAASEPPRLRRGSASNRQVPEDRLPAATAARQ